MSAIADNALNLSLRVGRPYNADPLLAYLRIRALAGVEQVDRHRYARVIRMADESRLLAVDFSQAFSDGVVTATCNPGDNIAPEHLRRLVSILIDADAPVGAIERQLAGDRLLAPLVRRNSGSRIPRCVDPFELAVRAILGQQVSVAAARTLAKRIVDRWGWAFAEGGAQLTSVFPDPGRLVDARLEEAGLSRGRARAIRELSDAVIGGRIELRPGQGSDSSEDSLLAIPGIGPWTAAYVALRGLGDRDAIPTGDLGLRQVLAEGGGTWTARKVAERTESWRPWRGYGAIHLWNTFLPI